MLIPLHEDWFGSQLRTSYFATSCLVMLQGGLSLCHFPVFMKATDHLTIYYNV